MHHTEHITQLWARIIIDEAARCGVRHFVISPGSRSTPLVLACTGHPDITDHSVIDERSAAFFALGLGKSTGQPVGLVCTSGTAAANYFPAVCEADAAGVPLLLFTADRPGHARDSGAPQTMDQWKLFGDRVRWFADTGLPEVDQTRLRALRAGICHAYAASLGVPRGPVHINVPFRKPLEPAHPEHPRDHISEEMLRSRPEAVFGRADGRPWTRVLYAEAGNGALEHLADALLRSRRPVILAGPNPEGIRDVEALWDIAERQGIPVFSEAASQLRTGERHPLRFSTLDLLLRSSRFRKIFQPDLVLQLGGVPTNASVLRFIEETAAAHICLSGDPARKDAGHTVRLHIVDREAQLLTQLSAFLQHCPERAVDSGLLQTIRLADTAVRALLAKRCRGMSPFFEGAVMHALAQLLPRHCSLFVSSSMPVRDIESYTLDLPEGCRLYFNRGVNGIDGIVSTALGMAHGRGHPSVLITGDIAFLHNLNAVIGDGLRDLRLVVLLMNNDGGEIFDLLPVRECDPAFTRHFITPHGVDCAAISKAFGTGHQRVAHLDELSTALAAAFDASGVQVVEVQTAINESGNLRRTLMREIVSEVDAQIKDDADNATNSGLRLGESHPLSWRRIVRGGQETVLLLHGFTRSHRSWLPVLTHIPDYDVITVDLMGHGDSPCPSPLHDEAAYRFEHSAVELKRIIDQLGLRKVHLVGYSLGGRLALHVATHFPDMLRSLALISMNPGIEDEAERARRRDEDAQLIASIGSEGLARFVEEWSQGPLFAAQRETDTRAWREVRAERLRGCTRGLQGSLLGSGQGAQTPLWDTLPRISVPALVVAGGDDTKYSGIARRMAGLLPRAEPLLFEGCGHDVLFSHAEQLATVLRAFWKRSAREPML
ncbi:MAG: 2-succinyl-5-enolpyruvyl-6-hydroxy-3-cyclohexene-1-carboxylic-acid synthase [Bacteroidetes bacterium]|nr:2-succinyl-5-enolpyruvyl-6-hydroxy-3-cyclohexene-1-carboxylic-acid synthase [Bacteroidota bacterium]